jgi:hypothetical protein
MATWKELDKINVHRTYNLHFFDGYKASCLGSWNITKLKKTKKIMQCPPIKSPILSYGNGFFL